MVAEKSLEAWGFVRKVLADMTDLITQDARDERELLEGLRVLNRVATLCTELSLDTDTDHPKLSFAALSEATSFCCSVAISGSMAMG